MGSRRPDWNRPWSCHRFRGKLNRVYLEAARGYYSRTADDKIDIYPNSPSTGSRSFFDYAGVGFPCLEELPGRYY